MPTRRELLSPLPENEWDSSINNVAGTLGTVLNIHRMIAHHPALMQAFTPLRNYIVPASSLSPRHRELVILRVGHRVDSDYEWIHHVDRGQKAGLTSTEIERVKTGYSAEGWSFNERLILRAVDEMIDQQQLEVETAQALLDSMGKQALLDILFTVGIYLTLGTILNTFDVPFEDFLINE